VKRLVGKELTADEINTVVNNVMEEADLDGEQSLSFVEFDVSWSIEVIDNHDLVAYHQSRFEFCKHVSNWIWLIDNE
jgi:hypothetical protein